MEQGASRVAAAGVNSLDPRLLATMESGVNQHPVTASPSLRKASCPAVLCVVLFALIGCDPVASFMVDAPNRRRAPTPEGDPDPKMLELLGVDSQLRITVGPPEASLHLFVVEPTSAGRHAAGEPVRRQGQEREASASDNAGDESSREAVDVETSRPEGTVILLHGRRVPKLFMLPTAHMLAKEGFRCILVDMRGHGRSTGDHLTYGVQDAQDMSEVLDELGQRELLAGRVGMMGISYGAAVAIQAAAEDERIEAVVALAPFATLRDVVPEFLVRFAPFPTVFLSDDAIDRLIDAAANRAGFDPDEASPLDAITRCQAPILLIHGTHDMLVPITHSRRLEAAATGPVKLIESRDVSHLGLYLDPRGDVQREAPAWLKKHLKGDDDKAD